MPRAISKFLDQKLNSQSQEGETQPEENDDGNEEEDTQPEDEYMDVYSPLRGPKMFHLSTVHEEPQTLLKPKFCDQPIVMNEQGSLMNKNLIKSSELKPFN